MFMFAFKTQFLSALVGPIYFPIHFQGQPILTWWPLLFNFELKYKI